MLTLFLRYFTILCALQALYAQAFAVDLDNPFKLPQVFLSYQKGNPFNQSRSVTGSVTKYDARSYEKGFGGGGELGVELPWTEDILNMGFSLSLDIKEKFISQVGLNLYGKALYQPEFAKNTFALSASLFGGFSNYYLDIDHVAAYNLMPFGLGVNFGVRTAAEFFVNKWFGFFLELTQGWYLSFFKYFDRKTAYYRHFDQETFLGFGIKTTI